MEIHFVYAGYCYWNDRNENLISLIFGGMKKYNITEIMVTIISMERIQLISKERVMYYCNGQAYFRKESVNDDLDSFFEDLCLGIEPRGDEIETY